MAKAEVTVAPTNTSPTTVPNKNPITTTTSPSSKAVIKKGNLSQAPMATRSANNTTSPTAANNNPSATTLNMDTLFNGRVNSHRTNKTPKK